LKLIMKKTQRFLSNCVSIISAIFPIAVCVGWGILYVIYLRPVVNHYLFFTLEMDSFPAMIHFFPILLIPIMVIVLGILVIEPVIALIKFVSNGFKVDKSKGILNLAIALSILLIICSIVLAAIFNDAGFLYGVVFLIPYPLWILYLFYLQVRYVVTGEKSLKPTVILSIIGVVITVSVLIEDSNNGVGLLVPLIPWVTYLILNFLAKVYKPIRIVITANVCPKCQTSNRSVSKYCKDCGHSLSLQVARKQLFFGA